MKRAAILLFLLLHCAVVGAGDGEDERPVSGLEGVWKLCYEPGLPDVYEIDEGFLILMPDGRYCQVSESCCYDGEGPEPPFWDLGTYTVESDTVVFDHKRFDGTPYQIRLRLLRRVSAVFFDDPQSDPVEVDAMVFGENLNYSWCRVYPEKGIPHVP